MLLHFHDDFRVDVHVHFHFLIKLSTNSLCRFKLNIYCVTLIQLSYNFHINDTHYYNDLKKKLKYKN